MLRVVCAFILSEACDEMVDGVPEATDNALGLPEQHLQLGEGVLDRALEKAGRR